MPNDVIFADISIFEEYIIIHPYDVMMTSYGQKFCSVFFDSN